MDLHRGVGDAAEHLGREQLGHRRAVGDALAAVGARGGVVHHEPPGVDLSRGVREHPLDRLVGADRRTELHARFRVVDGRLEEALRGADRVRRQTQPSEVERAERDLEAVALVPDALPDVDAQTVEVELRRGGSMQTHLLVVRPDLESFRVALDGEGGDALRAARRSGVREDDEHIGDRRVRDERLRAVDDVRVAVAARGRLQTAGIAARARLGERVRADLATAEEIREITAAHLVRSADRDRGAAQTRRSTDDVPERRVHAGELLDGDAVAELSEALPAERLVVSDAEQPRLAHLRDERARDLVLLLDLLRAWREHVVNESADRPLKEPDVFRELGVHLSGGPCALRLLRLLQRRAQPGWYARRAEARAVDHHLHGRHVRASESVGAIDRVLERPRGVADLTDADVDVELVVEAQRRAIANARLADREVEAFRDDVSVREAELAQIRDASDLRIDQIVRVVHDVLEIRFAKAHALPVAKGECLHARQVSRLAWSLLAPSP